MTFSFLDDAITQTKNAQYLSDVILVDLMPMVWVVWLLSLPELDIPRELTNTDSALAIP